MDYGFGQPTIARLSKVKALSGYLLPAQSFGVMWQVKPNQASAHIPGTSPHPTPFPTVSLLALTLLLMPRNQISARQINALAAP